MNCGSGDFLTLGVFPRAVSLILKDIIRYE